MERRRATEGMYRFGELAAFVSMWSINDFNAGLVAHCTNCLDNNDEVIAGVFNQPSYEDCAVCYGTRMSGPHGGVKSFLIRPSLWTWGEDQTVWDRRGQVEHQEGTVTTTGDTFLQVRDFIFRGDGYRFMVASWSGSHLTTGMVSPPHSNTAVTMTYQVARESGTSQVQLIPPAPDIIVALLNPGGFRYPPPYQPGPVY